MQYTQFYDSPLGRIVLACDDVGLTGLWFDDGRGKALPDEEYEEAPHPHHAAASRWLDDYFERKDPGFLPPLHLIGTPFQCDVWEELLKIPYGETKSYGAIAAAVAKKRGVPRMAAQAVGGAVGRNNIVIIIPCHRVIGADGNLTGYNGGLEKKIALLALESADLGSMYLPKRKPEPEAAEMLPARVTGDGLRRYLSIVASAANPLIDMILIDEIDNGLHYSVYRKLWQALFTLAVASDKQLFVTTHSKETLCHLSKMLEENINYQKDFRLYTLEKTKLKGHQAYKLTYNGLCEACTNDIELRSIVL